MTPETMLAQAEDFGAQLRTGAEVARGALEGRAGFANIVLCGLGGSAGGARLAVAMLAPVLRVPVEVVACATLPGYVDQRTLVVATSYSGETRETLACFDEAASRGAQRVAITAGGALAARAVAAGDPLVRVTPGYQPRGALGLLLAPILVLLGEAGAVPDPAALLDSGADAADAVHADGGAEAIAAADRLAGRAVVLYGSGPRTAVAVRLKNQLNENAKVAAFAGALPEIAHNEVLGWHGAARRELRFAAVLLRDLAEPALDRAIADGVSAQIAGDTDTLLVWRGRGRDELDRCFALLAFGDRVSLALAEVEGVDEMEISRLTALKETLSRV